jgi:hypothetical protein
MKKIARARAADWRARCILWRANHLGEGTSGVVLTDSERGPATS